MVPDTTALVALAGATREAVVRLRPEEAEAIVSLLATAAFQLQAAYVGERLLDMCYDPACGSAIMTITSDHTAIEQAITNLVTRSPASVVDLCAAALARLAGLGRGPLGSSRERDAGDWRPKHVTSLPPSAQSVGQWFTERLTTTDWLDLKAIRDPVTHRTWRRDIQIKVGSGRNRTAPTAFLDTDYRASIHVNSQPQALTDLAPRFIAFAHDTYATLCRDLAALA